MSLNYPTNPLQARLAGSCYPEEAGRILPHFRAYFDRPGAAPWPVAETIAAPLWGIIAPHIDLRVSPTAYTHAFSRLLQAKPADTYIILGVGHRSRMEWSADLRDYVTPLGTIENNSDSVQQLQLESGIDLLADPNGHVGEHSIEFPLICLQAFRQLRGINTPFRYIPLLCGGLQEAVAQKTSLEKLEALHAVARALGDLLEEQGPSIQVIVSIDGCHIGPRFQHRFRVTPSILQDCADWENRLWNFVEARDTAGFLTFLGEDGNRRYFDGVGALTLFMLAVQKKYSLHRTHYEQWFEKQDASAVTFTSGWIGR